MKTSLNKKHIGVMFTNIEYPKVIAFFIDKQRMYVVRGWQGDIVNVINYISDYHEERKNNFYVIDPKTYKMTGKKLYDL